MPRQASGSLSSRCTTRRDGIQPCATTPRLSSKNSMSLLPILISTGRISEWTAATSLRHDHLWHSNYPLTDCLSERVHSNSPQSQSLFQISRLSPTGREFTESLGQFRGRMESDCKSGRL